MPETYMLSILSCTHRNFELFETFLCFLFQQNHGMAVKPFDSSLQHVKEICYCKSLLKHPDDWLTPMDPHWISLHLVSSELEPAWKTSMDTGNFTCLVDCKKCDTAMMWYCTWCGPKRVIALRMPYTVWTSQRLLILRYNSICLFFIIWFLDAFFF